MNDEPVAGAQYQISGPDRTDVIPRSRQTERYSWLNWFRGKTNDFKLISFQPLPGRPSPGRTGIGLRLTFFKAKIMCIGMGADFLVWSGFYFVNQRLAK